MLVAAIGLLHLVGFGALVLIVAPHRYQVGAQVFGIGLGFSAYTFGLRHAFDVDHIAAIDNTTRKLTADAKKPEAVGFWFAMGHSMMVLAVLVTAGTKAAGVLLNDDSSARHARGVAGTLASGGFLYLIGIINAVALTGGAGAGHGEQRHLGGSVKAQAEQHADRKHLHRPANAFHDWPQDAGQKSAVVQVVFQFSLVELPACPGRPCSPYRSCSPLA